MSTLRETGMDHGTMFRRSFRHMVRYPSASVMAIALPVVLMLLFVFVFGGTMGAGLGPLGTGVGDRAAYLRYLLPGILLIAIISGTQGTSISVSMDMATGIIARFRTMGIARGAVLAGHVLGATIQTMVSVTVVILIAVMIGARPDARPEEWLAAMVLLGLFTLAVSWLSAALGLWAKSVETASNMALPLMLLVFVGSGFVPTASLPAVLRGFAEHQPFSPIIETVRGLLMGMPIGAQWLAALAWCGVIGFAGYLWALRLYDRNPSRQVRILTASSA